MSGTPDVDLLAPRFNNKVGRFVSRTRDLQAIGVDVLVAPWDLRSPTRSTASTFIVQDPGISNANNLDGIVTLAVDSPLAL